MSTTNERSLNHPPVERLEDPPVARALFGSTRWAWLWLILRLYVSYEWLSAGRKDDIILPLCVR